MRQINFETHQDSRTDLRELVQEADLSGYQDAKRADLLQEYPQLEEWAKIEKVSSLQDREAVKLFLGVVTGESLALAVDTLLIIGPPGDNVEALVRASLEKTTDESVSSLNSALMMHECATALFGDIFALHVTIYVELHVKSPSGDIVETVLEISTKDEETATTVLRPALHLFHLMERECADGALTKFSIQTGKESQDGHTSISLPASLNSFLSGSKVETIQLQTVKLSEPQVVSAVTSSSAKSVIFDKVTLPPVDGDGRNALLEAVASRPAGHPIALTLRDTNLEAGTVPTFKSGIVEGTHAKVYHRIRGMDRLFQLLMSGQIGTVTLDYYFMSRKELVALKNMWKALKDSGRDPSASIVFETQFGVETAKLHALAPEKYWSKRDVERFLEGEGTEGYKCLWSWIAPLATTTGKPCVSCSEDNLCRYHGHKLAH